MATRWGMVILPALEVPFAFFDPHIDKLPYLRFTLEKSRANAQRKQNSRHPSWFGQAEFLFQHHFGSFQRALDPTLVIRVSFAAHVNVQPWIGLKHSGNNLKAVAADFPKIHAAAERISAPVFVNGTEILWNELQTVHFLKLAVNLLGHGHGR